MSENELKERKLTKQRFNLISTFFFNVLIEPAYLWDAIKFVNCAYCPPLESCYNSI